MFQNLKIIYIEGRNLAFTDFHSRNIILADLKFIRLD